MVKNIVFDWSGTLVDDLPIVVASTNVVLARFGKPAITEEEFRRRFQLPFDQFYDEVLPGVAMEEIDTEFHRAFREAKTEQVALLPHVREFLEHCKETDRRMVVLSSTLTEHVRAQAARFEIEAYFIAIYASVRDKVKVISDVLTAWQFDARETAFIGDMQHDVETAHHAGLRAIAVLTGYDGREKLAASSPDFLVEDLSALLEMEAFSSTENE